MSQAQIKALNTRIGALEDQLAAAQQQLVNTCALQIQTLFTNPVMIDSIAHRLLSAAANAIAHKASHAVERAPELQVLEGYIPGSLRAILNEDGSMTVEQQLKGAVNAGGQWESATEDYEEQGILETFTQLMAAYGAQAGRVYYITDTVTASTHREKLSKELAAGVSAASPEAELISEELELNLPEFDVEENGVCLELASAIDQTNTTSILLPLGSPVIVIREGEQFSTSVEEVQDGDVALVNEADRVIQYIVTGSSMVVLPNVAEGGASATVGVVRLGLKPWNSEVEGQVELAGDELTAEYNAFQDVTVISETGEIQKKAGDLLPRDILLITRDNVVCKEIVVSVDYTASAAPSQVQ